MLLAWPLLGLGALGNLKEAECLKQSRNSWAQAPVQGRGTTVPANHPPGSQTLLPGLSVLQAYPNYHADVRGPAHVLPAYLGHAE